MEDALSVRFNEGREEGREEAARNALAEGVPIELICKITGLDMEVVKELQVKGIKNADG